MFTSAAISVFKNATNKTYLRGISDAMELNGCYLNKFFKIFWWSSRKCYTLCFFKKSRYTRNIRTRKRSLMKQEDFIDRIIARAGLGEKYLEPKKRYY